jgi:hypothetical protein
MNYLLDLDFSEIKTADDFHDFLKESFGFPDFYGKNFHALIDCLSSLRCPEDGMSRFLLPNQSDTVTLQIKNLSKISMDLLVTFLAAIESVNRREMGHGHSTMIFLVLS